MRFLIWVNTNMDNLDTQTQERPMVFGPAPEVPEQVRKLIGPVHCVIPANTRVTVSLLEESVWYCLHPTEETNLQQLKELF
jgi:hypothetical protein